MIKYYFDVCQNTVEWQKLKRGVLSASRIPRIITPTLKVAENQESRSLVFEIVAERAYDYMDDDFQSYDMQRGLVEETYAKALYSEKVAPTKDCGFITNDKLGFVIGMSPDWLVGDDKYAECKSKKGRIQVKTILEGEVPKEHIIQIQAGLFISERAACDFISYGNGYPMMIKEVLPEPDIQDAIATACVAFEDAVKAQFERYMNIISDQKRFIPTQWRDPETLGLQSSDNILNAG
jgi:hypothetical protein